MIFTSINFLIFLIVVFSLFALIKSTQARHYLLLAASYVFYGAWNVEYLLLIAACSSWGWGLGYLMHLSTNRNKRILYLVLSISLSLGMLGYFKYANFFADNVVNLFNLDWEPLNILLPVGISFFTFQTMSYTIDLYRGNVSVCRSFPKFLLFVAFFPQLVAGPIVRASDFLPQLDKTLKLTKENILLGAQLFLGGALQKVLIADNLSIFVDPVFADPALYSSATLWLALISYSIQIFCDFSGYSLMAIGVARIFGFTLMENFRMPYISLSITEFWRRWHISLSFWLRDYLYISLGGNRKGEFYTRINLMITMLLGGLWHGASWNFVLWGALHGSGLIVHKYWSAWQAPFKKTVIYSACSWLLTYLFVVLCWLPFRSPDFATSMLYLERMVPDSSVFAVDWFHPSSLIILAVVIVWHVAYAMGNRFLLAFPASKPVDFLSMYTYVMAIILILLFAPLNTSPFIYFQF